MLSLPPEEPNRREPEAKKEVEPALPEPLFPVPFETEFKLFRIPIFTYTRTIDGEQLYKRIAARFQEEMIVAVEKEKLSNK